MIDLVKIKYLEVWLLLFIVNLLKPCCLFSTQSTWMAWQEITEWRALYGKFLISPKINFYMPGSARLFNAVSTPEVVQQVCPVVITSTVALYRSNLQLISICNRCVKHYAVENMTCPLLKPKTFSLPGRQSQPQSYESGNIRCNQVETHHTPGRVLWHTG